MAESDLTRFERWFVWLAGTPRGQFVFFLGCAGSLVLCVGADELAREYWRGSVFAPDGQYLWRGIEFGSALGLVVVISALVHSVPRLLLSPCDTAKNWEPTGWRLWVLHASFGCHLVLTLVVVWTLLWWCTKSNFSFFPPFCAMSAVQLLASLVWRAVFGSPSPDEVAEAAEAGQ
jgi:hypothetical protein